MGLMALSNKEKQEALRKRRAELDLYRREIYLSDDEFKKVKEFVKELRITVKITGEYK
jgi:hypothetical protein